MDCMDRGAYHCAYRGRDNRAPTYDVSDDGTDDALIRLIAHFVGAVMAPDVRYTDEVAPPLTARCAGEMSLLHSENPLSSTQVRRALHSSARNLGDDLL
jgi:hypothetical protein